MSKPKKLFAALLTLLLLLNIAPVNAFALEVPPLTLAGPQDAVQALSQLAADYWDDDYFVETTFTAGQKDFTIDGEENAAREAPVIEDGEVFLPIEAIAQLREPSQAAAAQDVRISEHEAEALGLEVQADADGTITVTAPFQTRRLLVKTTAGKLSETYGAAETVALPDNRFALQYQTEAQARYACEQLQNDPDVRYAEPDCVLSAGALKPISINSAAQATSWGSTRIGAIAFQSVLPANAPRITVAVLDTGVDLSHSMLSGRLSSVRWNFVDNNNNPADRAGHGTHVAGIVADATPSNVQIMPLKVLNDEGMGVDSIFIEALRYAADKGARVANMSLGGPAIAGNSWTDTIAYVHGKNMSIVAAAGNTGKEEPNYPAATPGVIAVSASDSSDYHCSFSNRGSWVDLGAPGKNIISAYPGNKTATNTGTSMAAPHVSAAIALILSYCAMPQADILPYLVSLCKPWKDSGDTYGFGAGILDIGPRNSTPLIQHTMSAGESALLTLSQSPPVLGKKTFASNAPNVVAVSPGGSFAALQPGTANVTVSDTNGVITTVAVTVKDVAAITLTGTVPVGHWIDRPLSLTATLYVCYTDGTAARVTVNENCMTGFVQGKRGWQTITLSYGGHSVQFPIWVDAKKLDRFSIWEPWDDQVYGQPINLRNAFLRLYWDAYAEDIPMTPGMCAGYDPYRYGIQEISVLWNGHKAGSFKIAIKDPSLTGARLVTPPAQTAVPFLEPLLLDGGVVELTYQNGNIVQVPLTADMLSKTKLDYNDWINNDGTYTASVSFLGKSAGSYKLFTPDPTKGITLVSPPNKTSYGPGEAIDPAGGMVRFTAKNGTTFDYPLQAKWCTWGPAGAGTRRLNVTVRNYELSGTSTSSSRWEVKTGLDVSYTAPAALTLSSVAVVTPPAKTQYLTGEKLSTDGGKIKLTMSDGSAYPFSLRPQHCTGFNPNKSGKQTVTVNFSGKTASFTVNVKARAKSVEILTLPKKLSYGVRESLDLTGGMLRVTNADGSVESVPMTNSRVTVAQGSGGAPGRTCFDTVAVMCDDTAGAEFIIVYLNGKGYLDGLEMSGSLYYKKDYIDLSSDIPGLRWTSSNQKVITVSAAGAMTYKGTGKCTLSLVFTPPGRTPMTVGKIDAQVKYTLGQWLLVIFLFGWIWL